MEKFTWQNKVEDVDDISVKDINAVANAVIDTQNEAERIDKDLKNKLEARFPVKTIDIGDNTITTDKLQAGSVTSAKIKDGALTGSKFADGSIPKTKLSEELQTQIQKNTQDVNDLNKSTTDLKDDLTAQKNNCMEAGIANYFDPNSPDNYVGKTINTDGSLIAASDYATTMKIPLEKGKNYTFRCSVGIVIRAFYDVDGNLIQRSSDWMTGTNNITAVDYDRYVRFAVHTSGAYSLNICESKFFDGEYHEFGEMKVISHTPISIFPNDLEYVQQSELIDSMKQMGVISPYLNLIDKGSCQTGKTLNPTNGDVSVWTSTPDRFVTDYIPVEYGKQYKCTLNTYGSICGYSSAKSFVSRGVSLAHDTATTITINSEDVKYIRLSYINTSYLQYATLSESAYFNNRYYDFQRQIIIPAFIDEYRMDLSKIPNNAGYITSPVELSWYKGKKLVSFGDSITAQEQWQKYVKQYFGFASHVNCGVGGSTVANNGALIEGTSNPQWMCSDYRINTIPSDADVILFFGGHNDWGYDADTIPFGEVGEAPKDSTFCGAYALTLKKLVQKFPNAKIITMSCVGGRGKDMPVQNEDMQMKIKGYTMTDYAQACIDVSKYYGIPCIDVGGESGISVLNREKYIADIVHPNAEGGKLIANAVINGLKRFEPIDL